ncbi:WD40 repeat-like protein [Amylostereum chailletii]|nr:WD40 repeat-like protein [Amylostereum chailletii]
MKFTKPAWVMHKGSSPCISPKRLSIFSVHVHPDGSRIATGGLDAKVRIWSTKPILNGASELSGRPPKSLCTLTMHTGPVLCVRWAHSGRWLASGSDDEIVMVWDLDPTSKGKVWGSDEINVEGWKPLKRLPGHESDVTDIAWSPEDRYLASVGLDSKVLVWDGYTLERLCKLDQHQGFVKGVCWDPVGEYLATQSDDRSVKIWRTTDWQLEAEVRKPFEDSPGSTFFRRLSWSPDGAHITASNATNNKGFVFIAAVIARNSWTSEISLVGHENTVEVAAYNPHIFLRDPSLPVATSNICSVVALGADDRSVSVWQTKSARPMIVAKEVFERQILDLSWSWDGLTLYAVSSDGTLAAFSFDLAEMEGLAPHSAQQQYLQKFGFVPPAVPEGYSHTSASRASGDQITPPPSPNRANSQVPNGFGTGVNGTGEVINKLVAKRNTKKKRLQPTFMGSLGGAGPSNAAVIPSASLNHRLQTLTHNLLSTAPIPFQLPAFIPSPPLRSLVLVPIDSIDGGSGKRRGGAMDAMEDRPAKARTLGGDRPRESIPEVKEISRPIPSSAGPSVTPTGNLFEVPPVLNYLSLKVADVADDVLEARNAESGGKHLLVSYASGKQTQWLDYLPSPAVTLTATTTFCAVGMLDGCLNIYSPTGRRLMPTLTLDSPTSFLNGNKSALVALTTTGMLHSWNVKKSSATFTPTSVRSLLSTSPNSSYSGTAASISSLTARPNGSPVINTTSGVTYSYDPGLCSFVKLTEAWWAEGSDAWSGRQRTNNTQVGARNQLIVGNIESAISEQIPPPSGAAQRPQWWSTALTLGHLESKLHAARILDSGHEYKQVLLVYAKKIADEGFRGKAEELVRELFGPIYWRPGMAKDDGWSPTLAGLPKRDLLKDVLQVFARSKTLTKMAMDWQDLLKKASSAGDD